MAHEQAGLTRCALVATVVIVLLGKTSKAATPQCQGKADILFILDSSGSIGQNNYAVMTSFVSDLTQYFTVGPQDVQFSALIFSSSTTNLFNFSTYSTNKDVSQALKNAQYLSGGTNTAEALTFARTNSFSPASGARPDTGKVAIVLTDGISNSPTATAREADQLKKSGVKVVAIGVGSGAVKAELDAIASSASLVYEVENFSVLGAIRDDLVTSACEDQNPDPPCIAKDGECEGKPNGNYPKCFPECQNGYYVTCSNNLYYDMPCPLGWYVDKNNNTYLEKMVYNPPTDTCELTSSSCPREPKEPIVSVRPSTSEPSDSVSDPATPHCQGKADILFILDSSGSIGQNNYAVMTSFVSDLTQYFKVGPQDVQFSALIFSSSTTNLFNFSTYSTNKDVSQALKNAQYLSGGTNTAEALTFARTNSFSPASGARPDTGKVAIVLTDGISNSPTATAREADLLKKSGVKVVAIGVGSGADKVELDAIASSPSLVYEVDNFSVLSAIRDELVTSACGEVSTPQPLNPPGCISDSNGCVGRKNANYPACNPLCQEGYYYSCSNGLTYQMPCGLAWYTSGSGTRFTARMVYDLASDSCELAVDYCPRDPWNHRA